MEDTVDRLDDAFRAPSPLLSRCVSCESPPPSGEVDCPLLDATLDEAIESLRNGEIASLHEAAVRYAVSDSLLYTRYYRKEPSQWPAPFGILVNLVRQMDLEFVSILFNGFNQGSRLRRTLSAKLEMLYTNENAIRYI
ncbi:uncharacterized protein AKAW2_40167S [Aspergillus luchuensis]|uniref:HTH psq-type domain-containing protein n=1 Tax=Aspergillus kawachii TaxID=1069201 RepID=A0A7R7W9B9_ASPKA|nr:uncharacterized protein AKAW2_40167S [Aspergillus luchuensis]BCR98484.1 hypothetical protein AKAW2_40167S [Aspergillus luchuensis]